MILSTMMFLAKPEHFHSGTEDGITESVCVWWIKEYMCWVFVFFLFKVRFISSTLPIPYDSALSSMSNVIGMGDAHNEELNG